ncbi:MAG: protease, partial [Oxalobacteraceae bacterium]|nr:protease [Oxalobacteraceae bacterium]
RAEAKEQADRRRAAEKKQSKSGDTPRGTEKVRESESNVAQTAPAKPSPEQPTPPPPPDGAEFASLRGKLRMPVKGELLATFGAKRPEGPSWKGLFIKAAEGTEIRASAAGEVIFSDWMRGFGNLIIIDHGAQYMTIYGNNQSLLKRPGDRIKAGEVIATAGNSGGNEQSGLYFEMRHQGRALDPLTWMNR